MRDVPDCLNRRYKALDDLIQELTAVGSSQSTEHNCSNDPGVKLMCDFWSILKADPDCNLTGAVRKRMGAKVSNTSMFGPRQFSCYMAQEERDENANNNNNNDENNSNNTDNLNIKKTEACSRKKLVCCGTNKENICCETPISLVKLSKGSLPLNKVLCNLKEAASYDKKCKDRIIDLIQTQNELRDQIQRLEQREKEGMQLLKQADCMWSCMEESYKKKLEGSHMRQPELMRQLKEVEANNDKWRKNKKDLEFQMNNLNKCHKEILEKIAQKGNDITCLDTEIADFQKRIDSNVNEIEATKKSMCNKKYAANLKIANYNAQLSKVTQMLKEENKIKSKKEEEGTKYIKEAREDLQKICRVLLQKKLENEDLKAEKDALREEIELLNQAMDQCKEKCGNKHDRIKEEMKNIDEEIANYKFQCVQCHQCVDTSDVRKICTDCPRCLEERECITFTEDGHCEYDTTMDCVCMNVKQKFLDNVFDNMYTVLARQATTKPGKAVAEAIVKCLKRSRNGKLNEETRRILQEFILTTVKKNLNLTIVGGAVKTRCEMDSDTYNQLMLCLKKVKALKPPKEDKEIPAKKESCRRWGGTSECNCPKGPKSCICTKKAPPPVDDKEPLPPPDVDPGEVVLCPHKESTACGPDCGMRTPSGVDAEVAWKREPCKPPCAFSTNMRAAQCMLGPEPLSNPKPFKTRAPVLPQRDFANLVNNSLKSKPTKPIVCKIDEQQEKKRYVDVSDKTERAVTQFLTDAKVYKEPNSDNVTSILNEKLSYENNSGLEDRKKIKIVVDKTESTVQGNSFTNLINTSSGNLEIVLNNKILDIIDKNTSEDPTIAITLNTRESGNIQLNLHSDVSKAEKNHSAKLTRSSSGNRLLGVSSSLIDILASKSIPTNFSPHEMVEKIDEQTNVGEFDKPESSKGDIKNKNYLMSSFLSQNYNKKGSIKLKVRGENGLSKDIDVPLTKTLSGNIAVDVNKLSAVGDIELTFKERPVIFEKSSSDTFLLKITKSVDDSNAMIRKTASGNLLVLPIRPTFITTKIGARTPKEKVYPLKIRDDQTLIQDHSLVIKTTSSKSFMVVADKEYETQYKTVINKTVGSNTGCNVSLTRTSSGKFEVNINDDLNKNNAKLVKSASGNIRIIPNLSSNDSSLPKTNRRESKVYSDLLRKLSEPNEDKLRESQNILRLSKRKSMSDSNLLQIVKILTPDQRDLLLEPSLNLKKTKDGQYAVVLDKTSKKSLINNLKTYLSKSSSQGLIPVRKTNSGEITISLGKENLTNPQFGSLKITPSGNIYLLVYEKPAETFSQHKEIDMINDDVNSSHFIDKVKYPVNKLITTTCNGQPDNCCNSSVCMCNQVKFKESFSNVYPLKDTEKEETKTAFPKAKCSKKMKKNHEGSRKDCNEKKSTEDGFEESETNEKCRARHIVIKPGQQFKPNKYPPPTEPCYYYVTSTCPHHIGRYGALSNEIIEIKGPCGKSLDDSEQTGQNQPEIRKYYDWDGIEQLPHQLPPFLRNLSVGSSSS